jgi:hypothetical protein
MPVDPQVSAAVSVPPEERVRGIPFAVPRSQFYYWTRLWQEGVRLSHEALERGDFAEFTSNDSKDVVRWLFDAEDD